VVDLRRLSSVTDFFVIATATSKPQVLAITEQIEDEFIQRGEQVWHIEGLSAPRNTGQAGISPKAAGPRIDDGLSWVLMDCGDLVIHLFNPPARDFYQLERLWGDAPRIPLNPNML